MATDLQGSYSKSLGLWISRHKQAMEEIREMEEEILNLHRMLCTVIDTSGGETVITEKTLVEMRDKVLTVWRDPSDGSVHLSVQDLAAVEDNEQRCKNCEVSLGWEPVLLEWGFCTSECEREYRESHA